jgi:LacI family transcriptional regulator
MATIRDVARLCGVSTATVSNVLNARPDAVSATTREKVLAAIRKLGYRPTALEHNQNAILTRNIVLVCGDLGPSPLVRNHYLNRIFDGILEGAAFKEWSVTVFVERMWTDSGDAVRRSYDGRCDGVVALAPPRDGTLVASLAERGVPVVSVGSTADLPGVSSVDIDNVAASAELTRHLLGLGHRRIAYFGRAWSLPSSFERYSGMHSVMERAGIADRAEAYLSVFSSRGGDETIAQLADWPYRHRITGGADEFVDLAFGAEDSPSAVVCWNDELALEVVDALTRRSIRVPEHVSVVGFDDTHPDCAVRGITTMRQPLHTIGVRAVDMLIARIESNGLPDENVRFKAELIQRTSSGPPNSVSPALLFSTRSSALLPSEVMHK